MSRSAGHRPGLHRPGVRALAVLAVFVLAGVVLGAVWSELVWSAPEGTVQAGSWFPLDERSLSLETQGTSTYVAVAAVGGLLLGLGAALVSVRAELLVLGAVVLGSVLATYLMWQVGTALGPPDPAVAAASANDGTRLPGELSVEGASPFLVLPATALVGLVAIYLGSPEAGRERSAAAAE